MKSTIGGWGWAYAGPAHAAPPNLAAQNCASAFRWADVDLEMYLNHKSITLKIWQGRKETISYGVPLMIKINLT